MAGSLLPAQVQAYTERGFVAPVRVMPPGEATARLAQLRAEARPDEQLSDQLNQKPYQLFPEAKALVHHPRILDAVESITGPEIVCWGGQFFSKEVGDTSFVSWHQDGAYWGELSQDVVTAWVALTPSTPENGCMRVVPGTQRGAVPHVDTFAAENLLSRGQEVAAAVHPDDAVAVCLQPGEMSLHHSLIVHSSEPNRACYPRIGFAIRYAAAHVLQPRGDEDGGLLVRGVCRLTV